MQFLFNIQLFAHKKGQGSVKNGRDSNPKYLGVKKYDGEVVKAVSYTHLTLPTSDLV